MKIYSKLQVDCRLHSQKLSNLVISINGVEHELYVSNEMVDRCFSNLTRDATGTQTVVENRTRYKDMSWWLKIEHAKETQVSG